MLQRLLWLVVLALVLTAMAAVQAEPRRLAGAGPPATTGIPAADAVVAAVLSQDVDPLLAIVRYTEMVCIDEPQGIGAPPLCGAAGVPSGSTVEVLPSGSCEAEYILRADLRAQLAFRFADPAQFYGVLRPQRFPVGLPTPSEAGPIPDYAVVFRQNVSTGEIFSAVHLLGGQIIALQALGPCGGELPDAHNPAWTVPPRPQAARCEI